MWILLDFPPIQDDFDEDDIRTMVVGRRQLSTEWLDVVHPPREAGQDWSLILPFPNTYRNAFQTMVDVQALPHVSANGKLCLFLRGIDTTANPPQEIYDWVAKIGEYVVMKDMLALSFALDYERRAGNPSGPQTEVGGLRAQAKPYGSQTPTRQTTDAAEELVARCMAFLAGMSCYESADCVVAMPPSDPSKQYNLPRYLAERIASEWGRENLTQNIRTTKVRNSIKGIPIAQKLDSLLGTIDVDAEVFHNKTVLLIDDLYQSGISMNYCALMLLRAGARKVFGLACEKTCRNDDNVGGR
jgi:hypothetical protein